MGRIIGNIKKIFTGGKKVCSQGEANLSCLTYKDGSYFIAHCLEFDLVAQGNSIEEARNNLAEVISEHIKFAIEKDVEDKSLFHPAPQEYWDIFQNFKSRIARQSLIKDGVSSAKEILDRMNCLYAHV